MTRDLESLASSRLWLAFATMLLVSGMANTFPVFFPSLLQEFRGSRGATGFTASLYWLGGAVLSPLSGYLVTRSSPRLMVTLGLAAAATGLAPGAMAPTLPLFILAVGVGGGIGVGLTGMVAQAALSADGRGPVGPADRSPLENTEAGGEERLARALPAPKASGLLDVWGRVSGVRPGPGESTARWR